MTSPPSLHVQNEINNILNHPTYLTGLLKRSNNPINVKSSMGWKNASQKYV